ncbi:MAG: sn-glycerol-3-phosphate ABC transporter ATP-binding protein UgpC [Clostridiales bacterium]|nr:sn-glycerol-3-phosphate ABC transporter ATP-binding protein UgpC [Clostridiales bacterium]
MASISLKNIRKVYGGRKEEFEAVKNFNLEIADKEFVVLVGPSGCGKSTTLRMIAGLEEITEGELKIGDSVVNEVSPKDRDIAMVFQNYALYPHMNVYQNMAFGLTLRKTPKDEIEKRVLEAANILDMKPLLKRKPRQLSGGQRQRVALGRAIVRHPKVFLLDEPLSNLDAKLRTQMRTEISKLHQKVGTTFVYVTHDQTEAMTMADRIVVMKDGIIQQVDTPAKLYHYPGNLFVAGFIGSPPMNFFEGTLYQSHNEYVVTMRDESLVIPPGKNKGGVLDKHIGSKVILGVRPEDILETTGKDAVNAYAASIDISEMMGSQTLVYFDFAGSKAVAWIRVASDAKIGKDIYFSINAEKIHLFDASTGKTITN